MVKLLNKAVRLAAKVHIDQVDRFEEVKKYLAQFRLAVVMIGGLVTSTLFTLLVLPAFYLRVHECLDRRSSRQPVRP